MDTAFSALQNDYLWLSVLLIGFISALFFAIHSINNWVIVNWFTGPSVSENTHDLATGRLVLALTGFIMVLLMSIGVAAIATGWPGPPWRPIIVRWGSSVGILFWSAGMIHDMIRRKRVLEREEHVLKQLESLANQRSGAILVALDARIAELERRLKMYN